MSPATHPVTDMAGMALSLLCRHGESVRGRPFDAVSERQFMRVGYHCWFSLWIHPKRSRTPAGVGVAKPSRKHFAVGHHVGDDCGFLGVGAVEQRMPLLGR